MTVRLTLVAHAATEAQRRSTFPLDEPILDQEAARALGLNWVAPRAEHIWSAPEQRTQQTAGILALQATTAEQLRDCDYGAWRGRAMDQVESDADHQGYLTAARQEEMSHYLLERWSFTVSTMQRKAAYVPDEDES